MTSKLIIDKSLKRCLNHQNIIADFCIFCAKDLSIKGKLIIEVVSAREKNGISTTAFYDPGNHLIRVYGKNRAVVDICRSIAHEMTHMSQMLAGRINFPVQDVGGNIENEANARAGELIKAYALSSPHRKRIYESIRKKRLL